MKTVTRAGNSNDNVEAGRLARGPTATEELLSATAVVAAHQLAFIVLAAGLVALLLAGPAPLTIGIAVTLVEASEVMVGLLLQAVTHVSRVIIRNNWLAVRSAPL